MASSKPSILLMADHFLPGYKAGGPIRSILNLVEELKSDFRFSILTRDRDLGVSQPYPDLETGVWHVRDGYEVKYVPPRRTFPLGVRHAIADRSYDLIYLNSFFSNLTVSTLVLRRLGLLRCPIVLAPRGELASSAMRLKYAKKLVYRRLALPLGLYRRIVWHASSDRERDEILRFTNDRIVIAPNLPTPLHSATESLPERPPKQPGAARFVFLGRVARMKNLAYALRLMQRSKGDIVFDVYGTEEDRAYLEECLGLIRAMPPNVQCTFHGPVPPHRVQATLAPYHFFLLPTLRENFGHVILEALVARLPVLISNETMWRDLERYRAGHDLPLADERGFLEAIQRCVAMERDEYERSAEGAYEFGMRYVRDPSRTDRSRNLFLDTLETARRTKAGD